MHASLTSPGGDCGHQHLVEFYDTAAFLVDTVGGFVGSALRGGDAALVVATAAHREAFEAAPKDSGVDLASATSSAAP
ncbi:MAG: hypothetical protein Q8O56_17860 [Solirubrobacteraceae bacterium]|nr:hypothetical protein [Solirubrobacteraceae bacterium]